MNEIIVTENLTKKYSNFIALNDLNLKIEEKSCVGFLGPNGAGKSTTIKILTGLLRPSSGKAYIAGKDETTALNLKVRNFKIFCEQFKIQKSFSTVAHPQENGQVEAVNKILKSTIKKQLEKAKGGWVDKLPFALWAY